MDEIYIQVYDAAEPSTIAWYNSTRTESYLMYNEDLWAENTYGDYLCGTPFKSVSAAKKAAKIAERLLGWDGAQRPKSKLFTMDDDGDLIEVK